MHQRWLAVNAPVPFCLATVAVGGVSRRKKCNTVSERKESVGYGEGGAHRLEVLATAIAVDVQLLPAALPVLVHQVQQLSVAFGPDCLQQL